jgi:hypothetical protein
MPGPFGHLCGGDSRVDQADLEEGI